jgi:hypothetical protein
VKKFYIYPSKLDTISAFITVAEIAVSKVMLQVKQLFLLHRQNPERFSLAIRCIIARMQASITSGKIGVFCCLSRNTLAAVVAPCFSDAGPMEDQTCPVNLAKF